MQTLQASCHQQENDVLGSQKDTFRNVVLNVCYRLFVGFPCGAVLKNPPAMQETGVWSLGQEGPLEEGMAIHSSILAWRNPWTEEPGGLQSMGSR